jgi:hypothetical protein
MILFHVELLDFDRPEVRSRAWLPACHLRRAGIAARLVEGDVPRDLLSKATCLILTGGFSAHALNAARQASRTKVPTILDVGSAEMLESLISRRKELLELAKLVRTITAGNAALAHRVEQAAGMGGVVVAPDPIDLDDWLLAGLRSHPHAVARAMAKRVDGLARDAVARLRRRWRGHALSDAECRRIVWFGASRTPNGEGGVAELLLAASDLADLAEELPLRLDVVGRSPRAARRMLRHLRIPIAFYRYSPARVRQQLHNATLCLLPAGGDPGSLARSPARAALATALGIPVVTPAAGESMLPAMRAALAEQTATTSTTSRANREQEIRSVSAAWRRAIDAAQAAQFGYAREIAIREDRRLRVQLLLQQFQDIDLIVPIAEAASADPDIAVRVAVLSKIAVPASRRLRAISGNGGRIEFWQGGDLLKNRIAPTEFAADVAVTASEGPGVGARLARKFVAASRAAGARVLSLQHGLDNGGLTFGPKVPPHVFRADLVLTWGGLHRLSGAACDEVRQKTVPVGCPKRVWRRGDFPGFPFADRPFVAVFENLHWRRYNDDYRNRFVADLIATAATSPEQLFLVKPHMGGQWFTRGGAAARKLPPNLVVADPGAAQWRRFTADAFLAHASAVITTPSTIALDAARYGVPTALVTYGIAAQNYAPLPRLEQAGDWAEFVRQAGRGLYDRPRLEAFFADAVIPGDAVARILTVIKMAGGRRSYGEILSALDQPPCDQAAS